MAKLDELDALLQSLQALKPPGASKSKITGITSLCVEHIASNSIIAQKLFTHFKRTLSTHKLGVLFVIDSVTRQWIERARQTGQELSGSSAPDGTFASGVYRMTELMPSLLDDLLRVAPDDQKVKVQNLVDIWERGNTFPAKMLADFKQKLKGPAPAAASFTPPGSPPKAVLSSFGISNGSSQQPRPQATSTAPQPAASTQPNAASILAALAGMGNPSQLAAPPPPPSAPTQDLSALFASVGGHQAPHPAATPQNHSMPAAPPQFPSSYPPPPGQGLPPQFQGLFGGAMPPQPPPPQVPQQPPAPPNPLAALASILPPHILGNPESLAQVLKLFQDLATAGIPQEQWGPVVAALYPQTQPAAAPTTGWQPPQQTEAAAHENRYDAPYGGRRDRSRSPDYRRERKPVNRRPSPVYGTYDATAAGGSDGHDDTDRRGRRQGGRGFRQRTPPAARNGGADNMSIPPSIRPKWTDVDPTIPPGHIKVLSRTLFVGGASGTESDLRAIFGRFGPVQTCIVNNDKRHAFIKMCTRQDAVNARAGMENPRDPEILAKARQTRWGVGFGPRECCDYSTGVSTIPIDSLTEADHKWVLTAEYGGTGGRPVESGLVMEEPDIEIGAGVSSKAMSRRVMPDTGGKRRGGGGGGGGSGGGGGGGRFRQPEPRYESPRPEPVMIQPPPPVPNFGFQFAMPGAGGMPYQ